MGNHRFYIAAAACFALGVGLIICHPLLLPGHHSLAMVLLVVGIAVAIFSGFIMAIPLIRAVQERE